MRGARLRPAPSRAQRAVGAVSEQLRRLLLALDRLEGRRGAVLDVQREPAALSLSAAPRARDAAVPAQPLRQVSLSLPLSVLLSVAVVGEAAGKRAIAQAVLAVSLAVAAAREGVIVVVCVRVRVSGCCALAPRAVHAVAVVRVRVRRLSLARDAQRGRERRLRVARRRLAVMVCCRTLLGGRQRVFVCV